MPEQLAALASEALGESIAAARDPVRRPAGGARSGVQRRGLFRQGERYRPLGDVSPVVRTLAREQFDDYVKRVRIFAHPRVAAALRGLTNFSELLTAAIDAGG